MSEDDSNSNTFGSEDSNEELSNIETKFQVENKDHLLEGWKKDAQNLDLGDDDDEDQDGDSGENGGEDGEDGEDGEKKKRKRAPPKCSLCVKAGKSGEGHNARTCKLNPNYKQKEKKAKTEKEEDGGSPKKKRVNASAVIPILQQEIKDIKAELDSLRKEFSEFRPQTQSQTQKVE